MALFGNLEPFPAANPDQEFPNGDIRNTDITADILSVLERSAGPMLQAQMWSMAQAGLEAQWTGTSISAVTRAFLCACWGRTITQSGNSAGPQLAGAMFDISVGWASGFLPRLEVPLDDELVVMSLFNDEMVQVFAGSVWTIMAQSHPEVHRLMAPMRKLLVQNYAGASSGRAQVIEAVSVLPYILSSQSRLLVQGSSIATPY